MSDEKLPYWHQVEQNARQIHIDDSETQQRDMKRYVLTPDKLAQSIKKDNISAAVSIGICMLILVGAVVLCACDHLFIALILAAAAIAIPVFFIDNIRHRRTRTIKYSLVYQAIDRYFHPEIYLARKHINDDIIHEADIVDDWDSAFVSDYFKGSWRECIFEFGDLTVRGVKDVSSHKPSILFTGQLFIFNTDLELHSPISIRERLQPLSAEMYAGCKASERFFQTGCETFDRQFEVRIGDSQRANGFEDDSASGSADMLREQAHRILDAIAADIVDADSYAVSRTQMRFIGNRLYLAIENTRDTFELNRGDLKNLDLLKQRFDEEVQDISLYLDKIAAILDVVRQNHKTSSDSDPA